jgi:site-specific DNA-cytosine methylase
MFVLENVTRFQSTDEIANLMSPSGGAASLVDGLRGYDVQVRVLTPVDFNSPQSRQRVFIVGVRGRARGSWTVPVPLERSLFHILDERKTGGAPVLTACYVRMLEAWGVPPQTRGVIDFNVSSRKFGHTTANSMGSARRVEPEALRKMVHKDVSPCLVSHSPGLYIVHLRRFPTTAELLAIQGFDSLRIPPGVTYLQVVKLVGNSMSVPVLKALFQANLRSLLGR